jgi:hypothetical protein
MSHAQPGSIDYYQWKPGCPESLDPKFATPGDNLHSILINISENNDIHSHSLLKFSEVKVELMKISKSHSYFIMNNTCNIFLDNKLDFMDPLEEIESFDLFLDHDMDFESFLNRSKSDCCIQKEKNFLKKEIQSENYQKLHR